VLADELEDAAVGEGGCELGLDVGADAEVEGFGFGGVDGRNEESGDSGGHGEIIGNGCAGCQSVCC